jgi:arginyl-tRNA synthetase
MIEELKEDLSARLANAIRDVFGIDHRPVIEVPPRRDLGDLASPAALHLARTLKRKPRQIAAEILAALELPRFARDARVEGAGYLNVYLDRSAVAARLLEAPLVSPSVGEHVIVEHTNINPNKAAHIGHLRNAVLGDVLVRCLKSLGCRVETQNYIDDTGVQVADVVVGFVDLRQLDVREVAALPEPFDFLCWDLYSEVGRWYEADPARETLRRQTLHALESGKGPRAEMGRLVARRVLRRHLGTMRRLDIGYDLLTHESDILAHDFFAAAFEALKAAAAVRLEKQGRNAGCWVMPLSESEDFQGLEEPDKVIVRSDGTVTYVGKDIAYQLWKFGLLGRDFHYRFWEEEEVWETAPEGVQEHPEFGSAQRVINVIDTRQSYLQKIVIAGLAALGHQRQAAASVHFSYEMVSLSPATARVLGFLGEAESNSEKRLEMSGRKGIGVKADDLLDQLEVKSRQEIRQRNRDLEEDDLDRLAGQISCAAVRFFMAKATTNRVIAFDFDEALNFEGETGPYLQYSLVRAKNIQRRLAEAGIAFTVDPEQLAGLPAEVWKDDLWDLLLGVAQISEQVARSAAGLELSILARSALELAQKFNAFYHRHPILQESDEVRRAARLGTTQIFRRGLMQLTDILGLPVPERM